jgi:hypothetical protein
MAEDEALKAIIAAASSVKCAPVRFAQRSRPNATQCPGVSAAPPPDARARRFVARRTPSAFQKVYKVRFPSRCAPIFGAGAQALPRAFLTLAAPFGGSFCGAQEECMFSFDSPESPGGLYVNMSTFQARAPAAQRGPEATGGAP